MYRTYQINRRSLFITMNRFMLKFLFSISFLLFAFSFPAYCQTNTTATDTLPFINESNEEPWRIGIRVGGNFYRYSSTSDVPEELNTHRSGFQGGVIADKTLGRWMFQPGLFVFRKGNRNQFSDTAIANTYIEIPLQVNYQLMTLESYGRPKTLHLFAAPYSALAIRSHIQSPDFNGRVPIGEGDNIPTLDYGLKLGINITTGIFEGMVGYDMGFANIGTEFSPAYSNGFFLMFGVVLGK